MVCKIANNMSGKYL